MGGRKAPETESLFRTLPDTRSAPHRWPVPAHDLLHRVPARAVSTVCHCRTGRSVVRSDLPACGPIRMYGALSAAAALVISVMSRPSGLPAAGGPYFIPSKGSQTTPVSLMPVAGRDRVRGSESPGWTRSVAVCYITSGMKARLLEKLRNDIRTDHQCRRTWL